MNTELLKLNNDEGDSANLKYAASLVEQGELVVFPTETVYGIAAKISPESIAKLDRIKERESVKHYTLHLGSPAEVYRYLPGINLRAKCFLEKALPGPITVVFDVCADQLKQCREFLGEFETEVLYKNGSIGVRCPDNPVAMEFLSYINAPVVAPSANPSGMEPATNAVMACEMLESEVAVIIDAGECKEKINSTVVRFSDDGLQILRQGAVSDERVSELSTLHITIVCSGNTCRSPMAEVFLKKMLAEKLCCNIDQLEKIGYKVTSAGVMAAIAEPATQEAIEVCEEMGLDLTGHRSSGLTESRILQSDLIFTMSEGHRQRILDFYPQVAEKCKLLSPKGSILDPFGGDIDIYRNCASKIKEALKERLSELPL